MPASSLDHCLRKSLLHAFYRSAPKIFLGLSFHLVCPNYLILEVNLLNQRPWTPLLPTFVCIHFLQLMIECDFLYTTNYVLLTFLHAPNR